MTKISGESKRSKSGGSNSTHLPFEDAFFVASDSEMAANCKKQQIASKGRGALIGGVIPDDSKAKEDFTEEETEQLDESENDLEKYEENSHQDDLESGINPPESDYASHAPSQVLNDPAAAAVLNGRNERSLSALVEPLKRKPYFFVTLCIVSLVLIGGIVVVVLFVFTGDGFSKAPMLTSRQQNLHDIVVEVSDSAALSDSSSPQFRAREWLLFEDSLSFAAKESLITERVIQRYSLAVFYFATGGPNWESNVWLQDDECADAYWDNMVCNSNNEIQAIALDNIGLIGSLPSEIGRLTKLENFIIKNERGLSGTLPSTIGNIISLKQLGLYYNALTGTIPVDLFRATNLRYVNLEHNKLKGTLPRQVELLKRLETLVISNNNFEGELPWEGLVTNPIKYVSFSENEFSGSLPKLSGFPDLRFLYMEGNRFTGTVPAAIADSTNLKSVNLDRNSFSGTVPSWIGHLSHLEYISMQSNLLSGPLPHEIFDMTSLITLSLSSNKISGTLPDLERLNSLRFLYLHQNALTGSVPNSAFTHESLEILFLSGNKFQGIPFTVSSTNVLHGLYLSSNKLVGPLPSTLCEMKKLEALFLDGNEFSGEIPACIGGLSSLQQLFLFKNKIVGQIPPELSLLRLLSEIGLENNNISGEVPNGVCTLASDQGVDFWSDCGGDAPQISCPCCTVCCPSPQCGFV